KRYLAYSEKMYQLAPNDFNSIMELSYSHNSLGSLYLKQFNYTLAKQSFTESLKLKNQALELKPNNKNLLRDKTDTISWIASTEERLGNLSEALTMLEQAINQLDSVLKIRPDDASLLSDIFNIYMQQSYLLSYFPDKQDAYRKVEKALFAINKARLQDPENENFKRKYYRALSFQLMLSKESKTNIDEIVSYTDSNGFEKSQIIEIQLNTINYLINVKNFSQAESLLLKLENNTDYKERESNKEKIESNIDFIKVGLIKAKLSKDKLVKSSICRDIINSINENHYRSKSIRITHPLIQAYTCLNKESEVNTIKSKLIELGITNFDL
ncbi:MAG: transcriptional regulator, partial [Pseudomonadota bacterium]